MQNISGKSDHFFLPIDLYLGDFITSLDRERNQAVGLAASMISRNLRVQGHVCLNLRDCAGMSTGIEEDAPACPNLEEWIRLLKKSQCVGAPGEYKPLILDEQNRLYFHRYWQYEQDIVEFIRKQPAIDAWMNADHTALHEKLRVYFPEINAREIYWPAFAAVAALIRKFLIITGSPGTGKTSTIIRVLAFLLDVSDKPLRIALCAPTGKAAARLEEAVRKTKTDGRLPENILHRIPNDAMTIHRLLGSMQFSPFFRYNENNTLPYDIVVIDESSMADLPLMAKLMKALSGESRLILLGDKDQLASVEAGAVLGSLCFPEPLNVYSEIFERCVSKIYGKNHVMSGVAPGVQDSIIELTKNYRFREDSALAMLGRAVRDGNESEVEKIIKDENTPDISFFELKGTRNLSEKMNGFVECYREYLEAVASAPHDPERIFALFDKFRILCALRVGGWGVLRINTMLENILSAKGLIRSDEPYYEGKPIMISQNDYSLNLFNGDIGIALRDSLDNHKIKICFRDKKEGVRKIIPDKLPVHETVWAMTVHKSQGSEFDRIALILSDIDNPVLTRELVYTGITRARHGAEIWSQTDILLNSVRKKIVRESGLADALR